MIDTIGEASYLAQATGQHLFVELQHAEHILGIRLALDVVEVEHLTPILWGLAAFTWPSI